MIYTAGHLGRRGACANDPDYQLTWSTCNDDLVDLFSTIGKVERAEIQYEPNGRSRGTGVVQFDNAETAETAIGMLPLENIIDRTQANPSTAKFTGYQYGGRPLGITFVKYLNVDQGQGEPMEGAETTTGITQDQIM